MYCGEKNGGRVVVITAIILVVTAGITPPLLITSLSDFSGKMQEF
jgi:hypothetical protein